MVSELVRCTLDVNREKTWVIILVACIIECLENFKEMRKDHNFRSHLEDALDRILPNLWQDFGLDLSSVYCSSFFKKAERENEPSSFSEYLATNNKNFKS